jgi:hypothetical protein
MKLFLNLRIFLWHIAYEVENYLYPYKNEEPETDYFYIVKNDETGEEYTVLEWIKCLNQRVEKIEDDIVFINNELRKVDKLDLTLIELKKSFTKIKERRFIR